MTRLANKIFISSLIFFTVLSLFIHDAQKEKKMSDVGNFVTLVSQNKPFISVEHYINTIESTSSFLFIESVSFYDKENNIVISKDFDTDKSFGLSINFRWNYDNPLIIKINDNSLYISKIDFTFHDQMVYIYIFPLLLLIIYALVFFTGRKFSFDDNKNLKEKMTQWTKEISTVEDFYSLDMKYGERLKEKICEVFLKKEQERSLLIESLKKKEVELKNELNEHQLLLLKYQEHEEIYSNELSDFVYSMNMLVNNLIEISNDKNELLLIDAIKGNINNSNTIIKLMNILNSGENIHSPAKISLFDEIHSMVRNNHSSCIDKNIELSYCPNPHVCDENHGYGDSIGFILDCLLRQVILSSSINSKIEIETFIERKNEEDYIRFCFKITGGNKTIINDFEQKKFKLIKGISTKYSDLFYVNSHKSSFNGNLDIEINYETRCSISLYKNKAAKKKDNAKIAVYDKNMEAANRTYSSLLISGYSPVKIDSMKNIEDFDLVFVSNFSPDRKDHQYLISKDILVCSIEKEIDYETLELKRKSLGLAGVISYASKIKDFQEVVRNTSKLIKQDIFQILPELTKTNSNLPEGIQDLLGKTHKKEKLVFLSNNEDSRKSISTSLGLSGDFSIMDFQLLKEDDFKGLNDSKPNIILVDESFYFEGNELSLDNFRDKLRFNCILIGVTDKKVKLSDKFESLCDYIVVKNEDLIGNIISISSTKGEFTSSLNENVFYLSKR